MRRMPSTVAGRRGLQSATRPNASSRRFALGGVPTERTTHARSNESTIHLGVPERAQFDSASALLNHIVGLAGQYAAGARLIPRDTERSAFLAIIAERWAQLDPSDYPFVRRLATKLPGHDDRQQFLADINLILAGITIAVAEAGGPPSTPTNRPR
jgi:hypothetical protein